MQSRVLMSLAGAAFMFTFVFALAAGAQETADEPLVFTEGEQSAQVQIEAGQPGPLAGAGGRGDVTVRASSAAGTARASGTGREGQAEPTPGRRTSTVGEGNWTRPTPQEIEAANRPRHYDLPPGAIMSLTIKSIGIYGAPVFDSVSPMALAKGVAHLPDTSLPWSPTPQRNVYLAGHRMGFRGTWSRMLFYNLDKLGKGDKVVLRTTGAAPTSTG